MQKLRIVKCRDIGIDNCDHIAIGSNIDEVEASMFEHIENEHRDILEKMTEDEIHHLKHRVSTFLGRSCGCGKH